LPAHACELRVRYIETDQGGVVYHANYLVYFEVGRTELMRALGCPYASIEELGFLLTVVESHLHYRASARYDDLLVVESSVAEVRRVRLKIATTIRRKADGKLLSDGWIWLACIDREGRVQPFPEVLERVLVR
jgi:acyl-CoA thioester hydrolase